MVTAETAVVLPVLLLVLAGAVAAVTVVGAQLRCVDAAREGARAAARGEDVATVRALVLRAAPAGMTVAVVLDGEDVRVAVSGRITPLGPVPLSVDMSAEAVGRLEPAVSGAGAGEEAGTGEGAGDGVHGWGWGG
jgi:Flp pilus assembly protein TadG